MNLKQTFVGWVMIILLSAGILWAIYAVQEASYGFVQSTLFVFHLLVDIAGFYFIFSFEPKRQPGTAKG